jgi:hypothetical protein
MADSETIKTFQHNEGEIVYSFEYDKIKVSLRIEIINKLLCEEYSVIFDNSSNIFNGHGIIDKPSILFDIFVNHFEKDDKHIKLTFEKSCEPSTTTDDHKKYNVSIELNLNYISDDMSFEVPHTNKHVTQRQVIERIDYRFGEYIPTVESKIQKMKETIERLKTNEIDELKTKFVELQKKCDVLVACDTEISKQYEIFGETIEQLKTDRIALIEKNAEECSKNTANEFDVLKTKFPELRRQYEELQRTKVTIQSEILSQNHPEGRQRYGNIPSEYNMLRATFNHLLGRCDPSVPKYTPNEDSLGWLL